ncbi:MAG: terminase large subunit domain-containing protein [Dehalococcoidia bacterium]
MSETLNIAGQLKKAARIAKALTQNRLSLYRPYSKQADFHDAGEAHRERLLLAGNQVGKTAAASMEVAMHLTGRYPDWWKGKRLTGPNKWWVASTSNEMTRDTVQRLLLGEIGQWGTGAIPKQYIDEVKLARGITGGVDLVRVKHASGGLSYVSFKSYEQSRLKWQGESLHGVWFDEEPPRDIYTEGLTRTNARDGIVMLTMTPLLGMTEVIHLFYPHPTTLDRHITQMTIDDAEHFDENAKEQIIASYPPHEREARIKGRPMLGSGRVFPIADSEIAIEPIKIPDHWAQLAAIDFGYDHPTAAVKMAWDRDTDTIYITNVYRKSEATPQQHAMTLRHWETWLPWVWPHDGNVVHDRGSGQAIAAQYRREGLHMMREHATFADGGYGTEAGVLEMLQYMQTGRWKVFENLEPWFQEFHVYHRKDGKIVKQQDDLMSASRVATMGKRYARTREPQRSWPTSSGIRYDPLSTSVQEALR